jgi:uncharacterized protein (TIGR03067 family)
MSTQEAFETEAADDWLPLLDHELNRLPEKYRLPVVLCDLEGKTRKEAARHLDWPEGTVATRLTRGRALLACRLTRKGVALTAAGLALGLSHRAFATGIPAALLYSTVRAATDYAACPAAAAAVPARIAALTEGVLKTMLITRLKTLSAVALVLGLLGTGLGTGLVQVPASPAQDAPPQRTSEAPPEQVPGIRNISMNELPSGLPPVQAVVSLDEDGSLIAQTRVTFVRPVTSVASDGRQVTFYRQMEVLQSHHIRRGEFQAFDTKLKKISPKELRKRLKDETPALVFWTTNNKRIDPLHMRFIKEGTMVFSLSQQLAPPTAPAPAPAVIPPPVAAEPLQPVPAPSVGLPLPTPQPLSHPPQFIPSPTRPSEANLHPIIAPVPASSQPAVALPPVGFTPGTSQPPAPVRAPTASPLHPLQILLHQDGASKLLRDIQGEWSVVTQNRDGKRVAEDEYRDYHVVIRGGKMWLTRGNTTIGGKVLRLEIDSSKSPPTIDTYLDGPQPKKLSRGILKLEKMQNQDVLMIIEVPADHTRPTSFEDRPPTPWFGTVYKRLPTVRQE